MRKDNLPNGPKNAIPDRELTDEFIAKWDKDLKTIHDLDSAVSKKGSLLIVKGGLAVEAFAGGKLTRSHNDIDATLVNPRDLSDKEIFAMVDTVIKSEVTPWVLYHKGHDKIEYREKEDERPFFNRRRLELYIKKEVGEKPEVKTLVYSDGRKISVKVSEFYPFVAHKIRKLFLVNDTPEEAERETNKSDYTDLLRLTETAGYDKKKALKSLTKVFKHVEDTEAEALREYEYVMGLVLYFK